MNRISLFLLAFWLFCVNGVQSQEVNEPIPVASSQTDVYVIPITDAISTPNLYILRRGLKDAIANDVEMVILDMDTP